MTDFEPFNPSTSTASLPLAEAAPPVDAEAEAEAVAEGADGAAEVAAAAGSPWGSCQHQGFWRNANTK